MSLPKGRVPLDFIFVLHTVSSGTIISFMGRLFVVATVFFALAAIPAFGQRGAGRAAGGHSGFAGGSGHSFSGYAFSGRASGSRSFSGGHDFSGRRSGAPGRGMSRGNFDSSFRQSRSRGSQHRENFRNRKFAFRNCFGCRRFFSPYGYSAFYDPYWWWDSGSNYDEDREREIAEASQMNQQSLGEQRDRQEYDQDIYAPRQRSDSSLAARGDVQAESLSPTTILVFHDQHKLGVQNYAIVGQTLWSFSGQRTHKIPLASLDLAATVRANDEQGLSFRVPETSQGQ
jgi:hypothetical protein